jgi:hypothetical protein
VLPAGLVTVDRLELAGVGQTAARVLRFGLDPVTRPGTRFPPVSSAWRCATVDAARAAGPGGKVVEDPRQGSRLRGKRISA